MTGSIAKDFMDVCEIFLYNITENPKTLAQEYW